MCQRGFFFGVGQIPERPNCPLGKTRRFCPFSAWVLPQPPAPRAVLPPRTHRLKNIFRTGGSCPAFNACRAFAGLNGQSVAMAERASTGVLWYAGGMRYLPLILLALGCSKTPEAFLSEADFLAIPHVHNLDESACWNPTTQIIHIADYHFVEREDFEADGGEDWEQFLKDVRAVQAQQIDVLTHLRDHHGIDEVFLEGMVEADVPEFNKISGMLRELEKRGGDASDLELALLVGAAARVEGLTVLPAENADALEAANPVKNGKVEHDPEAERIRENAIVENLLASGKPVVVILLGGDHDLSDNVPDGVDVVRVQVKEHYFASGEMVE